MQARQAYASTATITRSSDVTPYTSGDVVGNSISATAAIEFQNIAPSGGGDIIIVDTQLRIDLSTVPSGMTSFTLALYSVTPPSAIYDNVAWDLPSGDRASFLGRIDLGTPVDLGSTLYVQQSGVNLKRRCASSSLFGYLIGNGGWTPSNGTVYTIKLDSLGV